MISSPLLRTLNLCYQAQEEYVPRVHPLRVEFKYAIKGQGIIPWSLIIMCNRDWWERMWDVCGRSNLPQKKFNNFTF